MISFIKSLFGIDSVVNSATKIIDKIAGTDWTAKEKAEWVIKYHEATRHQSTARRFIALLVSIVWFVVVLAMAIAYIVGDITTNPNILMIAKDMKSIIKEVLAEPFNMIIGFYYAVAIMNNIKK